MSERVANPEEADAELSRHIAVAEEHLKAISADFVTLLGTDASIVDAERRLADALNSLMELRRKLGDLRMIERPD